MKNNISAIAILVVAVLLISSTVSGKWLLPDEDEPRDRIVGGSVASWKYRKGTALTYFKRWGYYYRHCTGSMIGRKWILSAAHCFEDGNGDPMGDNTALFGVIPAAEDATAQNAAARGIPVKHIYVHKDYNGGNMRYDIAILELESYIPWEYYKKVDIVDVPDDNTRVKAVGYGDLGEDGPSATTCMMVDVIYREFDWCWNNEQYDGNQSEEFQICAVSLGWPAGRTDTCYGDSGGPLYLKRDDDELKQIGITSFSNTGCAEEYGIPWYVRAHRFKWGMNDLMENGNYGPYHRFAGDRTTTGAPSAAPSPSPSPNPPSNSWWPSWWIRSDNTTLENNSSNINNNSTETNNTGNINVTKTLNESESFENDEGIENSTVLLSGTMQTNGTAEGSSTENAPQTPLA